MTTAKLPEPSCGWVQSSPAPSSLDDVKAVGWTMSSTEPCFNHPQYAGVCGTDARFSVFARHHDHLTLSHALSGSGKATVDWGNGSPHEECLQLGRPCVVNNVVKLRHNGKVLDTMQSKGKRTTTFLFVDGDTLSFEEGAAIICVNAISFQCSVTQPSTRTITTTTSTTAAVTTTMAATVTTTTATVTTTTLVSSAKFASATATTMAIRVTARMDPCRVITCALYCLDECGWHGAAKQCLSVSAHQGLRTSQHEMDNREGDCPAPKPPTPTAKSTPATSTSTSTAPTTTTTTTTTTLTTTTSTTATTSKAARKPSATTMETADATASAPTAAPSWPTGNSRAEATPTPPSSSSTTTATSPSPRVTKASLDPCNDAAQFTCVSDGVCIPRDRLCDQQPDCKDNSDEAWWVGAPCFVLARKETPGTSPSAVPAAGSTATTAAAASFDTDRGTLPATARFHILNIFFSFAVRVWSGGVARALKESTIAFLREHSRLTRADIVRIVIVYSSGIRGVTDGSRAGRGLEGGSQWTERVLVELSPVINDEAVKAELGERMADGTAVLRVNGTEPAVISELQMDGETLSGPGAEEPLSKWEQIAVGFGVVVVICLAVGMARKRQRVAPQSETATTRTQAAESSSTAPDTKDGENDRELRRNKRGDAEAMAAMEAWLAGQISDDFAMPDGSPAASSTLTAAANVVAQPVCTDFEKNPCVSTVFRASSVAVHPTTQPDRRPALGPAEGSPPLYRSPEQDRLHNLKQYTQAMCDNAITNELPLCRGSKKLEAQVLTHTGKKVAAAANEVTRDFKGREHQASFNKLACKCEERSHSGLGPSPGCNKEPHIEKYHPQSDESDDRGSYVCTLPGCPNPKTKRGTPFTLGGFKAHIKDYHRCRHCVHEQPIGTWKDAMDEAPFDYNGDTHQPNAAFRQCILVHTASSNV